MVRLHDRRIRFALFDTIGFEGVIDPNIETLFRSTVDLHWLTLSSFLCLILLWLAHEAEYGDIAVRSAMRPTIHTDLSEIASTSSRRAAFSLTAQGLPQPQA